MQNLHIPFTLEGRVNFAKQNLHIHIHKLKPDWEKWFPIRFTLARLWARSDCILSILPRDILLNDIYLRCGEEIWIQFIIGKHYLSDKPISTHLPEFRFICKFFVDMCLQINRDYIPELRNLLNFLQEPDDIETNTKKIIYTLTWNKPTVVLRTFIDDFNNAWFNLIKQYKNKVTGRKLATDRRTQKEYKQKYFAFMTSVYGYDKYQYYKISILNFQQWAVTSRIDHLDDIDEIIMYAQVHDKHIDFIKLLYNYINCRFITETCYVDGQLICINQNSYQASFYKRVLKRYDDISHDLHALANPDLVDAIDIFVHLAIKVNILDKIQKKQIDDNLCKDITNVFILSNLLYIRAYMSEPPEFDMSIIYQCAISAFEDCTHIRKGTFFMDAWCPMLSDMVSHIDFDMPVWKEYPAMIDIVRSVLPYV